MPHLTEVQPSPQQNDNLKKLNIETDVVHVPLASDPDVSDASVGEAPVSTVTSGGEEPLSAEDMLKLMAESERAAIAVTDLNVPPPVIVTSIFIKDRTLRVIWILINVRNGIGIVIKRLIQMQVNLCY